MEEHVKTIVVVPDGMSDRPILELDGKTPWQAARTPNWDRLAATGEVGIVLTVPEGMYPGSDVANMSLMGIDPREHPTGRGPLEAAALGIHLGPTDLAFRCSLISTDGERILDHSAGNIPDAHSQPLMQLIAEKLGTRSLRFHPGIGYRHVLVWEDGPLDLHTEPPHDHVGEPFRPILPQGDGDQVLRRLIDDSINLLMDHPINRQRLEEGMMPGNMIWPWGQSRAPLLPNFDLTWGVSGAVVAAVDLIKGLGALQGMTVANVPGATGYVNTDYAAKARAALELLETHDFVYIHIEAPDEAGHHKDFPEKIYAIEQIDEKVVGTLLDGLRGERFRMLIVPDHATPVELGTHAPGPVPYLLFDSLAREPNIIPFDERALEEKVPYVPEGHQLIKKLVSPT
jgi:2,3-bisphosphoglycerate-independent phosphoglycerate mutase